MSYIHLIGDVHGSYAAINVLLTYSSPGDAAIIIGDVGLGFLNPKSEIYNLTHLNNRLVKAGLTLYLLRGNHDNPAIWCDGRINNSFYDKFSNIKLVKDFSVLEINGKRIGFVGGAISVDRTYRKEGVDWWSNEAVVQSEEIKNLTNLDILLTHTVADTFSPFGGDTENIKGFISRDFNLLDDLRAESKLMGEYFTQVKEASPNLKTWYYGHFHREYSTEFDGIEIRCLDINEIATI